MTKILLIDDDQAFNEATKEVLEDSGYEVICAFDGKQGLKQFEQQKPDLVVTDIIMPVKNGLEFLNDISDKEGNFPCKIIVISGGDRRDEASPFMGLLDLMKIDKILKKPYGFDELLSSVENCIGT